MTKIIQSIVVAGALFSSFTGFSQIQGGNVTIEKEFNARLLETKRQDVAPQLPAIDTSSRTQKYTMYERPLKVNYLAPQIRPLAMRTDDIPEAYNGFARLGGGAPNSVLGDLSYHIFKDDKYDIGGEFAHHSANNNKTVENQRFSKNHAGLGGTYYFDEGYAVNAGLNYDVNTVHFYNYNTFNEELDLPLSFLPDEVKQRFSTFSGTAGVFNGERTVLDFNYDASVDFYFLTDLYAARENGFTLNLGATKWFNDKDPLTIKLRTDFTNFQDTAKQTLNNFYLSPSYTFHSNRFSVKLGANITSHEDEFSIFPDVEANVSMVPGIADVFVGAEGSLQKNTFRSLSDYNPFIDSKLLIENTRYNHFYGGLKGNLFGVNYRGQIGYKNTENLALFLWNRDTIGRFNVLYDTANIFNITLGVTAPLFKGFELSGNVTQNFYSLQREEKPWHLPALTINAQAKYSTLQDKLAVKANFFLENGVPVLNDDLKAENLNLLFDLSFGADYMINKNFGLFAQVNNLANNKRQRWQNYPTFGLNGVVGLLARF